MKFLKQTSILWWQCDNDKGRGLHLPKGLPWTWCSSKHGSCSDRWTEDRFKVTYTLLADWIYKLKMTPNLSSMTKSAQHIIHRAHSSTILQQRSSTVVQTCTNFPILVQWANYVTAESNGISRNKLFGMPACIGATSDKSSMGLVYYLEQPWTKSSLVKIYLLF